MIVVVRNASGFDLFLAISADEKAIRFRVFTEVPRGGARVHKLRHEEPFAIGECPEGVGVRIDVSKADLTLRAVRRREVIDHLDEFHEIDGKETYLILTLHLLN